MSPTEKLLQGYVASTDETLGTASYKLTLIIPVEF